MLKLEQTCYTCLYKNGYRKRCLKCDLSHSHWTPSSRIEKQFKGLEKFMIDRTPEVSIIHIKKMYRMTTKQASEYYWKWRKEYMKQWG